MGDDLRGTRLAVISGVVGAAAGVAITVALYEGGKEGTIEYAVAQQAEPAAEAVGRVVPAIPRAETQPRNVEVTVAPEALEDEIADLEEELDRLRVEAAMAKGQLSHYEGDPQPWPEDVPQGFMPTAFETTVREALADREDAELLDVDCSEFPCVAVIRSYSGEPDWHQGLQESIPDPEGYDGEVGKMVWASESESNGASARLLAVAMVPEEFAENGQRDRTEFRVGTLTEDLVEEVLGEP